MNLILRRFNKNFGFVWIVLSGIQQKTGEAVRDIHSEIRGGRVR